MLIICLLRVIRQGGRVNKVYKEVTRISAILTAIARESVIYKECLKDNDENKYGEFNRGGEGKKIQKHNAEEKH